MRIAKWTLGIIAGLALLLIAAVIILTYAIDPNRYRPKLESIVGDLAGSPFVIEGDLKLTWYPWLGVQMGAARLGNPPGTREGATFIEWESMAVRARLLPLLKGQLVVDRVRLQAPHIRLYRDAQGRGNWEGLGSREPLHSGRTADPSGSVAPPKSTADLSATAAPAASAASQPASAAPSTTAAPAANPTPAIPPSIAGIEIQNGELDYFDEASGQHFNLKAWHFDMGAWDSGKPFDVRTQFLLHGDGFPAAGIPTELGLSGVTARLSPPLVTIPKLSARFGDTELTGGLTWDAGPPGAGSAGAHGNGIFAASVPSVRKWADDFAFQGPLPRDVTALGKLQMNGTWVFSNGALAVKPIEIRLDDTTLTGWINRSADPKSAWLFELHGDHVDLARYFDVSAKKKRPFEIPVEALKAINANGSLIFDQAKLVDAQMKDVRLRVETPEDKP